MERLIEKEIEKQERPQIEEMIDIIKPKLKVNLDINTSQKHYDNTNGSLYQFCEDKELNSYEFDIIKRVMRCRKKGVFLEDLEKTKVLIDLYIKEQSKTITDDANRRSRTL